MNDANKFKIARFLYYAGCLTLCQLTIRPALSLTLSDWLFFAALTAMLVEIILLNRKLELRLPSLLIFSCLLFIAGGLLSLLNMNDRVTVLSVIARFAYISLVWFWLGTMVLRTNHHVQRATVFWLLSVAVTGIAAALQLIDPSIIPGTEVKQGRMMGFTRHPNDLGAMSAVGWGAACIFFSRGNLIHAKLVRFIVPTAILSGLILTGSTGCTIAALSATIYWLFITKSLKRWILIVLVVTSMSVPVLAIQHFRGGESVLHRLDTTIIRQGAPSTLSMRILGYKQALGHIIENPLIGVGFKLGGAKVEMGSSVHNVYLAAFYEAGLLGLTGIMLITLFSILTVKHLLNKASRLNNDRHFVIALSAALVAFFVYSLSAPVLYQRYGWISLSLLFSLRAVMKRERQHGFTG